MDDLTREMLESAALAPPPDASQQSLFVPVSAASSMSSPEFMSVRETGTPSEQVFQKPKVETRKRAEAARLRHFENARRIPGTLLNEHLESRPSTHASDGPQYLRDKYHGLPDPKVAAKPPSSKRDFLHTRPSPKPSPSVDTNRARTQAGVDIKISDRLGIPRELSGQQDPPPTVVNTPLVWFRARLTEMFPYLAQNWPILLERLAQQHVVRYKHLMTTKENHTDLGLKCNSGSYCINSTSRRSRMEGAASMSDPDRASFLERFPTGIPMPPKTHLPAIFECPLCFTVKTFRKPVEWTKHVSRDVQAFTCTFEDCRAPRTFDRNDDWIRHENEIHRRLEWWICDVGICRHTCYRRDNFLQHLIREHNFVEPKSKPPRRGDMHETWQKVIECQHETDNTPQQEPCKFCGKVLTSWPEVSTHLESHMVQLIAPIMQALKSNPADSPTRAAVDNNESTVLPGEPTSASAGSSRQSSLDQPTCLPLELERPEPDRLCPLGVDFPTPRTSFSQGLRNIATPPWNSQAYRVTLQPQPSPMKTGEGRLPGPSRDEHLNESTRFALPQAMNIIGALKDYEEHPDRPDMIVQPQLLGIPLDTSQSARRFTSSTSDPKFGRIVPQFPKDSIGIKDASTQTQTIYRDKQHNDVKQHESVERMHEAMSEDDVEMTSPQPRERATSATSSVSTLPLPVSKMRQVGVAQITIKMLSLLGTDEGSEIGSDLEFESDSDLEESSTKECWDEGGGEGSGADGSGAITATNDSQPWAAAPGSTSTPRGRPRPEDEDGERHRKRQKKQPGGLCSTSPQPRFACPFQAYEPVRDCLKVSTRNPLGGCESIKRVKQHLARRHMVSSRCNRCWASMETRKKLEEHQGSSRCPQLDKPTAECFMDSELEALVTQKPRDGSGDVTTPEKSWWSLFKMLIPGMKEIEMSDLKTQYNPYYKPGKQVLMTPALVFPDWCNPLPEFSMDLEGSSQQMTWGQPSGGFEQPIVGNEPTNSAFNTFSTVLPESLSRSVSVPVFAVDPSLLGVTFTPAPPDMTKSTPHEADAPLDEFVSSFFDATSPIVRTPTATTSASSVSAFQTESREVSSKTDVENKPSISSAATSAARQLQRDYDMLKLRNQQTVIEYEELEKERKAARADVKTAQAILHEVMEMPEVQGAAYDRLLELAGILIKAGGRLR